MSGLKFSLKGKPETPVFAVDSLSWWLFGGWLLLIVGSFFLILYYKNHLPPEVPLFYSRNWGVERLAAKEFLFLLPFGNLFFGVFNFGFNWRFFAKERFLARVLQITSLTVALLTFLSGYQIVNLIQ